MSELVGAAGSESSGEAGAARALGGEGSGEVGAARVA